MKKNLCSLMNGPLWEKFVQMMKLLIEEGNLTQNHRAESLRKYGAREENAKNFTLV